VAYDTFLGASASGTNLFEVMVWLGVYGGVSPLSSNGYPFTPIATVTIDGTIFDLAYGLNGSVKVYSFVARGGRATNFSADLVRTSSRLRESCLVEKLISVMQNLFFKYLLANYGSNGFTSSLYLQVVQGGTEVFTGSNAKMTTTAYSIAIN
jgi:xyloglucan-specific endo-beta-1,4-glucanase